MQCEFEQNASKCFMEKVARLPAIAAEMVKLGYFAQVHYATKAQMINFTNKGSQRMFHETFSDLRTTGKFMPSTTTTNFGENKGCQLLSPIPKNKG